MKKIITLVFASILSTFGLFSQEKELKIESTDQILNNEIHLRFNSLSSFDIGISYKRQLKENRFLVLSLARLSYNFNKIEPENPLQNIESRHNMNSAFEIGYEFRNNISEKFVFYHGPNIAYGYSLTKATRENSVLPDEKIESKFNRHNISIPYNIGIMYNFTRNFFITAQLTARYGVGFDKNDSGDRNIVNVINTGLSFNNLAGIIAFGARF